MWLTYLKPKDIHLTNWTQQNVLTLAKTAIRTLWKKTEHREIHLGDASYLLLYWICQKPTIWKKKEYYKHTLFWFSLRRNEKAENLDKYFGQDCDKNPVKSLCQKLDIPIVKIDQICRDDGGKYNSQPEKQFYLEDTRVVEGNSYYVKPSCYHVLFYS